MLQKRIIPCILAFSLLLTLTGCDLFGASKPNQNRLEYESTIYIPPQGIGSLDPDGDGLTAEGELTGEIINDGARVYAEPDMELEPVDNLPYGQPVRVISLALYQTADLFFLTEYGFILATDIILGCAVEPGYFPVIINTDQLTIRSGPGTNFDKYGSFSGGQWVMLAGVWLDENGVLWGLLEDCVHWICLDYTAFPGFVGLYYPDGTFFQPDLNFSSPEDTPLPKPGDEENTPTTPSNPGSNTSPGIQPTPNNTPIVANWTRYNPEYFLSTGIIESDSITFYENGAFMTSNGGGFDVYMYETGSFSGAKGGAGEGGVYTFDGSKLVLQFDYLWYAGEFEPYDTPKTLTYSASLDGNFLTFNGDIYYNGHDWEDGNDMLRTYMTGKTGPYVKSENVGSWQSDDGRSLTLSANGTFTETDSVGNTYTGDYLFAGNYLYLSRTTKNGSPYKFYLYASVTRSGDTMKLEISDWFVLADTINYTKVSG